MGFYHFYGIYPDIETARLALCQCPLAGLYHFYSLHRHEKSQLPGVSMPSGGLIPFLQGTQGGASPDKTGVNALRRAYTISTSAFGRNSNGFIIWCQCPLAGLYHFYWVRKRGRKGNKTVSMPSSGLIPFLPYPLKNPLFMRVSSLSFAGNYQNNLKI